MIKFDTILAALPNLTPQQLNTLRSVIDSLTTAAPETGRNHITLFDAMKKAVNAKMPYVQWAKSNANRVWTNNSGPVIEFVEETWPEAKRSRVLTQALLNMLMDQLATELRRRQIPATMGTMAVHLSSVPEVFDKCFPGYRISGMAHLILKAMKSKPSKKDGT